MYYENAVYFLFWTIGIWNRQLTIVLYCFRRFLKTAYTVGQIPPVQNSCLEMPKPARHTYLFHLQAKNNSVAHMAHETARHWQSDTSSTGSQTTYLVRCWWWNHHVNPWDSMMQIFRPRRYRCSAVHCMKSGCVLPAPCIKSSWLSWCSPHPDHSATQQVKAMAMAKQNTYCML